MQLIKTPYKFGACQELTQEMLAVYRTRAEAEKFVDAWNSEHVHGQAYVAKLDGRGE